MVTNPPFSLFHEYVAQLMEYEKKFIIIGNVNAITYKDIFKLIKENKIWMGKSIHSGDREFRVPHYYPLKAAGFRVDEKGLKYIRVKGVRWFTNIEFSGRHEDLTLFKKYSSFEYPHYDNYDAIEVSKTAEIPYDYPGSMGVPITFLDKYNPDQFEIVDALNRYALLDVQGTNEIVRKNKSHTCNINGKSTYFRIVLKRKVSKNESRSS